jgi:UDP-2,3-diacylglucosamine hydrolase
MSRQTAVAPPPLPSLWEYAAPVDWRSVDFISDLHLSADTPRTFDAWSAYLRTTDADAVFILGDLFEVWAGDDSRHDEFEARCANELAEAACRRTVGFMAGNRDFLVGLDMLRDCGVVALPDPTVLQAFGLRVLLTHGDALCLDDTKYQQFRALVRSEAWQQDFLAKPLDERRRFARAVRNESEQLKRQLPTPMDWADVDGAAAVRWLHEAGATTMVHGHTHHPGSEPLAPGMLRHVLSDWELDHPPLRAEVLRLSARGFRRITPPGVALR